MYLIRYAGEGCVAVQPRGWLGALFYAKIMQKLGTGTFFLPPLRNLSRTFQTRIYKLKPICIYSVAYALSTVTFGFRKEAKVVKLFGISYFWRSATELRDFEGKLKIVFNSTNSRYFGNRKSSFG
jgi:hypothetical protein